MTCRFFKKFLVKYFGGKENILTFAPLYNFKVESSMNILNFHHRMAKSVGKVRRPPPKSSRNLREREFVSWRIRGSPASMKKCFGTLAGLPRIRKSILGYSRTSRKREKIIRHSRGPPARMKKCSDTLAGLPRTR